MRIVDNLEQGSEAWLAWRAQGIGASDARSVAGVDPWLTRFGLFMVKEGLADAKSFNPAMAAGVRREPRARAEFEWERGETFTPVCVIHDEYDWLRASLDGLSKDHKSICEIKCPGDEAHAKAVAGVIPEYYVVQMLHQFLAADPAEVNWYYSWQSGLGGVALPLYRKDVVKDLNKLLKLEIDFKKLLETHTPPEFVDKDYRPRLDKTWQEAAADWIRCKEYFDMAEKVLEAKRAKLHELTHGYSSIGAGVRVRISPPRRGALDKDGIISDYQAMIADIEEITGEPYTPAHEYNPEARRKASGTENVLTIEKVKNG